MKKSRAVFLLLVVIPLVLFSCSRESFSLSSSTFVRNITIDGEERKEEALITLSLSSSSDDVSYSFLLVSPDGDLRWEGKLWKNGSLYLSPALGITSGAQFGEGTYKLYIYSSSGSSLESELELGREEDEYTIENAYKAEDAAVSPLSGNGAEADSEKERNTMSISYTDRYSNYITIIFDPEAIESVQPSS